MARPHRDEPVDRRGGLFELAQFAVRAAQGEQRVLQPRIGLVRGPRDTLRQQVARLAPLTLVIVDPPQQQIGPLIFGPFPDDRPQVGDGRIGERRKLIHRQAGIGIDCQLDRVRISEILILAGHLEERFRRLGIKILVLIEPAQFHFVIQDLGARRAVARRPLLFQDPNPLGILLDGLGLARGRGLQQVGEFEPGAGPFRIRLDGAAVTALGFGIQHAVAHLARKADIRLRQQLTGVRPDRVGVGALDQAGDSLDRRFELLALQRAVDVVERAAECTMLLVLHAAAQRLDLALQLGVVRVERQGVLILFERFFEVAARRQQVAAGFAVTPLARSFDPVDVGPRDAQRGRRRSDRDLLGVRGIQIDDPLDLPIAVQVDNVGERRRDPRQAECRETGRPARGPQGKQESFHENRM
ncbi:MAG: hypothetical protein BWZ08_01646 [candidate division BRC1 bacterium ADurb.BinA292]|nr:MAG: hypothetical protein BWZ08_01646 [candidate division BRC1 bacterium ADurb.BinA292]